LKIPRTQNPLLKCLHHREKGFTLIELLVVIAILGIITAVAVPNITQFMGRGESEAAAAELHNVQVAASAASAEGIVGTVTEVHNAQIIADPDQTDKNAVGSYLKNNTAWKYTVTNKDVVAQDDKV